MFRWIVWRDLMLAWRRRADVLATLFFFVIVVSLFPLSISPDPRLLRSIAPGVVWVAALLASMLSLGRLFSNDYVDGTLEQMLLTPQPLYLIVAGKGFGAVAGIRTAVGSDRAGAWSTVWLVAEYFVGADGIVVAGDAGAEFDRIDWRGPDIGIERQRSAGRFAGAAVVHPGVDFRRGAVEATITGTSPIPHFELQGAALVLTLVFAPWATSAALRISLE